MGVRESAVGQVWDHDESHVVGWSGISFDHPTTLTTLTNYGQGDKIAM
jgi:hypothetical protein